jgi:ABC-2 type transport system ATP-binding protein
MRGELGAALLHRPPLLLLDEPTVGLDLDARVGLRRCLAGLQDCTILLTSHDLADVAAICPRVLWLDQGRLRHDGSLPELQARALSLHPRLSEEEALAALFRGSPPP